MNGAGWVWLGLALAIAVVDWIAVGTGSRNLEYVAKPLTMVALVELALSLNPVDTTARAWFVAALLLSLVGDVFLMLPRDLFVPGLASFLLGHVAYIVGLRHLGTSGSGLAVGAVVVLAALPVLGRPIVRAVRAGPEPELLVPVVAYMAVISAMVVTAAGTGIVLAAAGAIAFYASDALIAWTRFVRDLPWGRVGVIVTYHLAQVGLVLSLV